MSGGSQENDAAIARIQSALPEGITLTAVLGRGGFATVFAAHDKRLDRAIAIKVLHEDLSSVSQRERFRREAQVLGRLCHPGIVAVHDVGDADGITWYSMQLVRGTTLRARLEDGPLSVAEAHRMLREVSSALQAAHDAGILHRDIKPDNILIDDETGASLLSDFGIAKSLGDGSASLTATGMLVGTPQYMSPEQLAGDAPVTARSDLFSLGVVAYQALTGEKPFDAPALPLLIAKVLGEEPVPLTWHRPQCPPEFAHAVMRCLEKDADSRWASAADFAEALSGRTSASAAVEPPSPRDSEVQRAQFARHVERNTRDFRIALMVHSVLLVVAAALERSPYAAGLFLVAFAVAGGHLLYIAGQAFLAGTDGRALVRMAVGLGAIETQQQISQRTADLALKASRLLGELRSERRVIGAILLRLPQAELSRMPRAADIVSTAVSEGESAVAEVVAIDQRLDLLREASPVQPVGIRSRDPGTASELRARRRLLLEGLETTLAALRNVRMRIQSHKSDDIGTSLDTLASALGRMRRGVSESPTAWQERERAQPG